MCSPFQIILKNRIKPSIYYGYDTIYEEERKDLSREEYEMLFKKCADENKDLLMDMVRQQRNEALKETDRFVLQDYPITDEERTKVIEYRAKLRDITKGDLPKIKKCDYVLEFDLSQEALLSQNNVDV